MKRVFTVIAILVLVSCKFPYSNYNIDLTDVDVISPLGVSYWATEDDDSDGFSNITYVADVRDEWQTPLETWVLKTGDCEDIAILSMYICNAKFGIKPTFIGLIFPVGLGHAIYEYDGIRYDPTLGGTYNPANYPQEVSREIVFDYDKVMHEAEYHRIINY